MRALGVGVYLLAMALGAIACGGGEDGSGGAAGGTAAGMLGAYCTSNSCATGLTCGRDFEIANLCTASCTNDQSCSIVAPGSGGKCIVARTGFCMIPCAPGTPCPAGSQCGIAGGQMVCRAP